MHSFKTTLYEWFVDCTALLSYLTEADAEGGGTGTVCRIMKKENSEDFVFLARFTVVLLVIFTFLSDCDPKRKWGQSYRLSHKNT